MSLLLNVNDWHSKNTTRILSVLYSTASLLFLLSLTIALGCAVVMIWSLYVEGVDALAGRVARCAIDWVGVILGCLCCDGTCGRGLRSWLRFWCYSRLRRWRTPRAPGSALSMHRYDTSSVITHPIDLLLQVWMWIMVVVVFLIKLKTLLADNHDIGHVAHFVFCHGVCRPLTMTTLMSREYQQLSPWWHSSQCE